MTSTIEKSWTNGKNLLKENRLNDKESYLTLFYPMKAMKLQLYTFTMKKVELNYLQILSKYLQ